MLFKVQLTNGINFFVVVVQLIPVLYATITLCEFFVDVFCLDFAIKQGRNFVGFGVKYLIHLSCSHVS